MKKFTIIVLVFVAQIAFAQTTRFIYQVSMKPDSTDQNNIKTEMAFLDATPEKSIFYGEKRPKRDSLLTKMRETRGGSFDRTQMQNLRSNIDFTIEKDFKTGTKTFNSRIGRDQYSYDEDRPMEWKILAETATIGDYKTQKAETQFAGRTWYAWFATDIPIQDGPYKFAGLPGLIVKAEDAKGDYSFDLKETKKIASPTVFEQRGNIIKVKRTVFNQQLEKFRKDPSSFSPPSPPMSVRGNSGGMRSQTNPNQRKEFEQRMKDELKTKNNPIELK